MDNARMKMDLTQDAEDLKLNTQEGEEFEDDEANDDALTKDKLDLIDNLNTKGGGAFDDNIEEITFPGDEFESNFGGTFENKTQQKANF